MRSECGVDMSSLSNFTRRFYKSQDGGVAIYVALTTVIMIGLSSLAIDLGRLFTLQSELQAADRRPAEQDGQ